MAIGQGTDPLDLELLTSQAFRNQYLTLQERLAFRNAERETDNARKRERKMSCLNAKLTETRNIKREAKQVEIRPPIVDSRDCNTNPFTTYSTTTYLGNNSFFFEMHSDSVNERIIAQCIDRNPDRDAVKK